MVSLRSSETLAVWKIASALPNKVQSFQVFALQTNTTFLCCDWTCANRTCEGAQRQEEKRHKKAFNCTLTMPRRSSNWKTPNWYGAQELTREPITPKKELERSPSLALANNHWKRQANWHGISA